MILKNNFPQNDKSNLIKKTWRFGRFTIHAGKSVNLFLYKNKNNKFQYNVEILFINAHQLLVVCVSVLLWNTFNYNKKCVFFSTLIKEFVWRFIWPLYILNTSTCLTAWIYIKELATYSCCRPCFIPTFIDNYVVFCLLRSRTVRQVSLCRSPGTFVRQFLFFLIQT